MTGAWRKRCRPIIERVLAETAGRPEAEIRKALFEAYPFGERRMFPYQVWLSEIRRQRFGRPARPIVRPTRPIEGQEELGL